MSKTPKPEIQEWNYQVNHDHEHGAPHRRRHQFTDWLTSWLTKPKNNRTTSNNQKHCHPPTKQKSKSSTTRNSSMEERIPRRKWLSECSSHVSIHPVSWVTRLWRTDWLTRVWLGSLHEFQFRLKILLMLINLYGRFRGTTKRSIFQDG